MKVSTNLHNLSALAGLRRAAGPRPVAVSELVRETSSLSAVSSSPQTPPTLPSFLDAVDSKGSPKFPDDLEKATDTWVASNSKLSNPSELTAFQGLGRWLGRQAMLEKRPDWKSYEAQNQTFALWDDEYGDAGSAVSKPGTPERAVKIAPAKSLMVLRMLDDFVGNGLVDKAVRETLAESTRSAQSLEGFYSKLSEKAQLPPWSQARAWFEEIGHPMVASHLVQKQGKTAVRLSQQGFAVYPDKPLDNKHVTWAVPMTIKFKDEEGIKELKTVLDSKDALVALPAKGKVAWAYPNGGGFGVFRTRHTGEELAAITRDAAQLTPAEQGAVACNQWRLVRNGTADVGQFYDFVQSIHGTLDAGLQELFHMELLTHSNYVRPADREAFTRFHADTIAPFARNRGLNPPADSDQGCIALATIATDVLTRAGDPEALRLAQSWAEEFKRTGVPVLRDFTQLYSADPEVFEGYKKTALDPQAAPADRKAALAYLRSWPTKEGAQVAFSVLNDPKSGLDEEQRGRQREWLIYTPHGRDLVFAQFQSDPSLVEKHKDLVKNTYAFPCYREELDQLLASPKISESTRNELKAHFSQGDKATLARLSDSIHRWLEKAGYLKEQAPANEWNVV